MFRTTILAYSIFIIIFAGISLSAVSPAAKEDSQKAIRSIRDAFRSASSAELAAHLPDGKRVYSNWESVIGAKGYFGKSQILFAFTKFFKAHTVTSCLLLPQEIKEIEPDKILFRMNISYQGNIDRKTDLKSLYLLIINQTAQQSGGNRQSWVIVEIKTIQ